MNVKHVIGLAAIVLGGMTSCSNILEEDGVSNVITKGETGKLRLNLVTDGTLNVTTKATDEETIANTLKGINENDLNGFSIKGNRTTETESQSVTFDGYASEFENGKTVPVGTYTIKAEKNFANSSDQTIGFNIPHFKGEITNVKVEANTTTDQNTITVKLINSIISVNTDAFTKLKKDASITALYVKNPKGGDNFDLLSESKSLKGLTALENILFVDPTKVASVDMVITGTVDNGTKAFTNTKSIPLSQEDGSPKNYSVKYSISKENGTLKLNIVVDGTVENVDLTETIDPYNPTPSQES